MDAVKSLGTAPSNPRLGTSPLNTDEPQTPHVAGGTGDGGAAPSVYWIDQDEWYPVYSLETRKPYFPNERWYAIPTELVERYKRVTAEFHAVQDELHELVRNKP